MFLPLVKCATIKPPPPILPAPGYTTASANWVAIAASIALPPCCKIDKPTLLANGCADTTAPFLHSICLVDVYWNAFILV